jgi:hypothetical protein
VTNDATAPRTPAAAGATLLAGGAVFTLARQGASVPCRGLVRCRRTVTFDGGQALGLVVVAAAALAFAALVVRDGWTDEAPAASAALAALAGAYVVFVLDAALGTGLVGLLWPGVAAATVAATLLSFAAVTGRDEGVPI